MGGRSATGAERVSAKDELRSVRIEVENISTSVDAPAVGAPKPARRWLGVVGVLAAIVLGVAFVVLRPASDEAADGTVRETPPTTQPFDASASATSTPSTTAPPDDGDIDEAEDEREPTELSIALAAVTPAGRIDPDAILADVPFVDVVSIDDNFFALADVVATQTPPVYASADGVTWTEIEVSLIDTAQSPAVKWRQFVATPDGVAAVGFVAADFGSIDGERVQFEVATSQDGAAWQLEEPSNISRNGDGVALPIAVLGSSVVSAEASNDVLLEDIFRFDEVITEAPTLASICGAYGGPADGFTISECRDFSIVNELATTAIPDSPPSVGRGALDLNNRGPAFGECVAVASEFTTTGFTLFGPAPGSPDSNAIGGGRFAFAGTGLFPEFVLLADGRVAVVDRGTLGNVATCDFAGGFFRREGGIALVDFADGNVVTIQVAPELQPALEASTSVEFLGEFSVDDTRSHLFLIVEGDLWSVDTRTGRWSELVSSFVDSSGFARSKFVFSRSGSRLYRIDLNGVTAIDFSAGGNGSLSFEVSNWLIDTEDLLLRDARDATVLHATDQAVFLFDGSTSWRLAIPG